MCKRMARTMAEVVCMVVMMGKIVTGQNIGRRKTLSVITAISKVT